jgi:DNA-directed RNA polymerase sigma subunit (sigma70/sigma32)
VTKKEKAALRELERTLAFDHTKPHTLEEIADFLGVSVPYIFEVEKRALAKMQALLREQGKEDWQGSLRDPHDKGPFGT